MFRDLIEVGVSLTGVLAQLAASIAAFGVVSWVVYQVSVFLIGAYM